METVFDALKAMGKATSAELAARLDISREEVLNELWELKRNGVVDKRVTSGFWLEKVNPG
ncbi:DNA-binding protein [Escherichia coli]|nr:DNA-binding protein [Escherichia coli]EEC7793417.1 DNA-binding protein [Escherichia coli]EEC9629430.1 DNA-binding protein [Escherichia coli]EEQ3494764.1 DNA-binding protein [Escherichia coli]EES3027197.1 DNA-binding protein [Escherichia coli]